jgi:TonB family protein
MVQRERVFRDEVAMKTNVLLAFFLAATFVAACPRSLLADKTEKQYRHAVQLFRNGDLENAAREFQEILRAKPDYEEARIFLSLTHSQLGQEAERKRDRTRAIAELREALRLEPDEAYWHSELAKLLNEQGDAEGAGKECAQAAELSPDDSGLESGCGLKASEQPENKGNENQENEGGAPPKVFKVGGDVSAPIPTDHAEPPYSEKARLVSLQGATTLWVVVNAQGTVEQARVVNAVGLGLDQCALRTIRTWKFKPATQKGVPVPVRIMVELSFRLF